MRASRLFGVTVLDLVIVLTIFGMILAVAGVPHWIANGSLVRSAWAVREAIATSRFEALTKGAVTCISFKGVGPANISLSHRGLLFTPDGLPRTCDGGGVGNTTILLEHRGRRAAVIVSSLGRVRWELR